jgi:hypothetical protein
MRRKPFIAVIAFVISVIAATFLVLREEPKVPEKKEALIEPLPSSGVVTYSEGDTDQRRL